MHPVDQQRTFHHVFRDGRRLTMGVTVNGGKAVVSFHWLPEFTSETGLVCSLGEFGRFVRFWSAKKRASKHKIHPSLFQVSCEREVARMIGELMC